MRRAPSFTTRSHWRVVITTQRGVGTSAPSTISTIGADAWSQTPAAGRAGSERAGSESAGRAPGIALTRAGALARAARVSGPTSPSTVTPCAAWNWRVAASVSGPNTPSTGRRPVRCVAVNHSSSARCQAATSSPVVPRASSGPSTEGTTPAATSAGALR